MINEDLKIIKEQLQKIESESDLVITDKIRILFKILNDALNLFTAQESTRFTTIFAKISWVATKFQFSSRLHFLLQTFRRAVERNEIQKGVEHTFYQLSSYLCHELLSIYSNDDSLKRSIPDDVNLFFQTKTKEVIGFKNLMEGLIINLDGDAKCMTFIDKDNTGIEFKIIYDIAEKNELFTHNITSASKIIQLPLHVNLIDVELLKGNVLHPTAFVIHPDYLVDVTSVASASRDSKGEYWLYILNKVLSKDSNLNIMSGNLVGGILDEIIHDEEVGFNTLIESFFEADPLKWTLYDDDEVKQTIEKLYAHFKNIKRTISQDFKSKGIDKSNVYLEPSYYCRDYGIQGRLDLLHVNDSSQIDIIELKSSKPFSPNKYGITHSHYLQTLLYDLIIKSSTPKDTKALNYIFYSSLEEDCLKYAPVSKAQQYELMKVRNDIMIMDHALALSPEMAHKIISFLKLNNFENVKGFVYADLLAYESIYTTLDHIEKSYLANFISFIAREQVIAKVGEYGSEKTNGLAALWLENIEEKKERFAILDYMQLIHNFADQEVPTLVFQYSEISAKLSNFRVGDIAVVYPHSFNPHDIMRHQIFKATIVELDDEKVKVKLRHAQKNQSIFRQYDYWNLEQDVLDSSFRHMYKNLHVFTSSDAEKRKLILGRKRPEIFKPHTLINLPENLTNEQKNIIQKLFSCKDYMLLWGPPGTGKTSEILKNLSLQLLENTDERIMLLAYTNRAVDEICQALIEGGMQDEFIRIGSSLSVGDEYKENLLQNKIKGLSNRKDIKSYLEKSRIFVSTLSSLLGKMELFSLLEFHTVIVDEASQILEPMLCGVLTQFNRFILIGDHKQLPAVVAQNTIESSVKNEELRQVGINDTRTSLFERLYLQCKQNEWYHATELLSMQGRMHDEILQFVNTHFYEKNLKNIPNLERLTAPLYRMNPNLDESYLGLLTQRMVYIDTPTDQQYNYKTNDFEAQKVCKLIKALVEIYKYNGFDLHKDAIGVITPYKAQIAKIKSLIDRSLPITVDTVERFQGGAKDIIILSLCTNRYSQLNTLVSTSSEGIDRKLNVAITRTREQLIVLGNKEILSSNDTYDKLISYCKKMAY